MATYKVLQDIEAEDKFLGPLTLKQFIFVAITLLCLYISFFSLSRGFGWVALILLPIELVLGFLGIPWGRDQPTEVWLLAKLRFYFKPRRRIWDQTGLQELVKITVPKKVEQYTSDNLSQTEVKSRLRALADTIDSRGWIIKNVNVNMFNQPAYGAAGASDRLVSLDAVAQTETDATASAADDIFDNTRAAQIGSQISESTQKHRNDIVTQVKTAANPTPTPQPDLWFMNTSSAPENVVRPGSATNSDELPSTFKQPDTLSPSDQALLTRIHQEKMREHQAFNHRKHVDPMRATQLPIPPAQTMTTTPNPATIELARNNDRTVESLSREANKSLPTQDDDEVVISLH